jgi:hypothetical protein
MLRHTIITGLVVILSAGSILAQAKAPVAKKPASVKATPVAKPADDKAPAKKTAGEHVITVVSVSGIAEQRSAAKKDAKWTAIKAGDILNEMTLVRTGLGAKLVLKFSNRGVVTVKSGTKIGIASFSQQAKMVKTRLGLKYGAIRAKVDSTQGANDFRVRTAVGTLAATGTGGDMAQWGDFSFQAKGTQGSWQVVVGRRTRSLIPGEWTNKQMSKPLAALLKKLGVNIGDPHGGLTPTEIKNLLNNGAGRGVIGFTGNTKSGGAPRPHPPRIPAPQQIIPGRSISVTGTPPPPIGGNDPNRYVNDPENGRNRDR